MDGDCFDPAELWYDKTYDLPIIDNDNSGTVVNVEILPGICFQTLISQNNVTAFGFGTMYLTLPNKLSIHLSGDVFL